MKRILLVFLIAGSLLSVVSGCGGPHRKDPVTLDLWHNYGGTMQETMDELLNTFNATIGKEQGIIVNVTSVNSLSVLQEKLLMIARGDPGAPESPDLVTCYPKVAIALAEKGLLADLDEYFSDEELSMYVPSFIDEGRFNDGLYVFPIAKSTEVLFVNKTFFDRFSEDTGVTLESLSTFEGIAEAARRYYQWTDLFTDPASRSLKDDNINQLQEVAALMHKNYSFYVPPVFDTFETLEQEWESAFKSEARDARSRYLELVLEAGPDEAYRQAVAR